MLSDDFDVALVNFYLHLPPILQGRAADAGDLCGWMREFLGRLGDAPHAAAAARLRRRLWWRHTFPGERWHPHYPLFHRGAVTNYSALAVRMVEEAGYKVARGGEQYVNHDSCTVSESSLVGCTTADGGRQPCDA